MSLQPGSPTLHYRQRCPFSEPSFTRNSETPIKIPMVMKIRQFSQSPQSTSTHSMVPQPGPYREKWSVWRMNNLLIHLYLSESPVKELFRETSWQLMVITYGDPWGRQDYIPWVANLVPRGILYDTAVTTPVSYCVRHDFLHLQFGRPEPRSNFCRVSSAHLLPPLTWHKVRISTQPRGRPRSRIHGSIMSSIAYTDIYSILSFL